MQFASLITRLRALLSRSLTFSKNSWNRYRALPRKYQIGSAVLLVILIIGALMLLGGGKKETEAAKGRTVTLQTVGALSGTGSTVDLIGSVRSITEANILAQSGGTVRAVHTRVGAYVGAGSVIAELENASERAMVLQAEGAYDAAIAARNGQSVGTTIDSARNTARSVYTTLDTTLQNDVDTFFGEQTAVGPNLLIYPGASEADRLSRERDRLDTRMREVQNILAANQSPVAQLSALETLTTEIQTFLGSLATAANKTDARTTDAQRAALAAARASVNSALSSITSSQAGLRSGSVSATAGADASVKQALGSLRAAQASLERTIVRAPIGGQVNFLPIRVGDYVTPMQHTATVAQNGALEVVAYVSEGSRDLLAAGNKVTIDGDTEGVITSVAPALDPITKQIEVRVAVTGDTSLVNGQSVHIGLPDLAPQTTVQAEGPVLLPLAAVKLRASDRIVFTVGEDGRLVAHQVEVGEVRGDRIEVRSGVSSDLRIVTDARGLAEGEQVAVATETE